MKTIKNTKLVLAGILGLVIIAAGATANAAEYKNIIDLDRFVANLEDTATVTICSGTEKAYTAVKAAPETEYRNMINMDAFVAALKDPRDVEYRNVFTLDTFLVALGGTNAPEYRNVMDLSRFVAALNDPSEVEYRNIIDMERFVTALKEEKVEGTTGIACKDSANKYAQADQGFKSGI